MKCNSGQHLDFGTQKALLAALSCDIGVFWDMLGVIIKLLKGMNEEKQENDLPNTSKLLLRIIPISHAYIQVLVFTGREITCNETIVMHEERP